MMDNQWKDRRVCKTHLTGIWGKKDDGTWFPQCSVGFVKKEKCEELVEEIRASSTSETADQSSNK